MGGRGGFRAPLRSLLARLTRRGTQHPAPNVRLPCAQRSGHVTGHLRSQQLHRTGAPSSGTGAESVRPSLGGRTRSNEYRCSKRVVCQSSGPGSNPPYAMPPPPISNAGEWRGGQWALARPAPHQTVPLPSMKARGKKIESTQSPHSQFPLAPAWARGPRTALAKAGSCNQLSERPEHHNTVP